MAFTRSKKNFIIRWPRPALTIVLMWARILMYIHTSHADRLERSCWTWSLFNCRRVRTIFAFIEGHKYFLGNESDESFLMFFCFRWRCSGCWSYSNFSDVFQSVRVVMMNMICSQKLGDYILSWHKNPKTAWNNLVMYHIASSFSDTTAD